MIPHNRTAVARDGNLILTVERGADPRAKDAKAMIYDEIADELGPEQPLQVFFKWGNFVAIEDKGGPVASQSST